MPSLLDRLKKTVSELPKTVKNTVDDVVKDPLGSAKSAGKTVIGLPRKGLNKVEDGLIWITADKAGPPDPQNPNSPNPPKKKSSPTRKAVGWGMVVFAMVTPFTAPVGIAGGYILAKDSPGAQKKLTEFRKKYPLPFNGMIGFTRWLMPRIATDMDKMTDPKNLDQGPPPKPPADDAPSKDAQSDKPDQPKSAGTQAAKGFSFRGFDPRNYLPRGLGGKKRLAERPVSTTSNDAQDKPRADRRRVVRRQTPTLTQRPGRVSTPRL